MKNSDNIQAIDQEVSYSLLSDLSQLVKFRLNLFVVMSAVLAAAVAAGGAFSLILGLKLAIGGFLVTAAGAILNQVLEKEYDAKMDRTKDRPIAAQRMKLSSAILMAGVASILGTLILTLINPLTGFMGMLSFIAYAFVYTPLKRYHHVAVHFGAIPGALPMAIGVIAVEGTITPLAILLFSLQFIWQLPHFWAIAWISHDDYVKADFKLLPTANNTKNKYVGLHSFLYSLLLLPIVVLFYFQTSVGLVSTVALGIISLWYIYKAWNFYVGADDATARKLMFASFIYLPLALLSLMIGIFI